MPTIHDSSELATPPSVTAPQRPTAPRRTGRVGNTGTHTLITVASLLATTSGWAWIAHTERRDAAAPEALAAESSVEQAPALLTLAPIPTLVPRLEVQLPAAAPRTRTTTRTTPAEPTPAMRQVDTAAAAAIVPTAAPQVQAAVAQPAQVAPVQPAPVTRTRSSRRRTP